MRTILEMSALTAVVALACGYERHSTTKDGSGGSGGLPPNLPGADYLDPEEVLRAGVVFGSCASDDGIDYHIWETHMGGYSAEVLNSVGAAECLATAGGGCDAIEECIGLVIEAPPVSTCETACNNGVHTRCSSGILVRTDCNRIGWNCDPEAGCIRDALLTCDDSTFNNECSAGRPTECIGNFVRSGPLCEDYGLVCGQAREGTFACIGRGEPCDAEFEVKPLVFYNSYSNGILCDGDILELCVNRTIQSFDCAKMGPDFGCREANGQFFCGLGSDCIGDHSATCSGKSVVVCNMGRRELVDCTSLGFDDCDEPTGCIPSWRFRQ